MSSANEENPFLPPSTDDCYRDPRLHYEFDLSFEFTEEDLRDALRRYANDNSLVVLLTLLALILPSVAIAYLEEFRGVDFQDFDLITGGLLSAGFAGATWYLATLPIRWLTEKQLRQSRPLGLGRKRVRLLEETIQVLVDDDAYEFTLDSAIIKASNSPRSVIVEFRRHQILCLPSAAFHDRPHQKEFLAALKKRIRTHARVFWTTR